MKGQQYIKLLELRKNGDVIDKTITKDSFIDSLSESRLPLRKGSLKQEPRNEFVRLNDKYALCHPVFVQYNK